MMPGYGTDMETDMGIGDMTVLLEVHDTDMDKAILSNIKFHIL